LNKPAMSRYVEKEKSESQVRREHLGRIEKGRG
jgi:hypothetical protein